MVLERKGSATPIKMVRQKQKVGINTGWFVDWYGNRRGSPNDNFNFLSNIGDIEA